MMKKGQTYESRFWDKVDMSGECWEWTAGKFWDGYGMFRSHGRMARAHRISYELANGEIPPKTHIDHRCHNHGCVNPDHLRLATNKQNVENLGKLHTTNKSGFRGVYWHKKTRKWAATVRHNDVGIHIGLFDDLQEAAAAVLAKRNELYTHNDADRKAA